MYGHQKSLDSNVEGQNVADIRSSIMKFVLVFGFVRIKNYYFMSLGEGILFCVICCKLCTLT